jgi:hypothetical protein
VFDSCYKIKTTCIFIWCNLQQLYRGPEIKSRPSLVTKATLGSVDVGLPPFWPISCVMFVLAKMDPPQKKKTSENGWDGRDLLELTCLRAGSLESGASSKLNGWREGVVYNCCFAIMKSCTNTDSFPKCITLQQEQWRVR